MLPDLLTVVLRYQGQILVCVFGLPDYFNVISLLPVRAFDQIEIFQHIQKLGLH